MRNYLDAPVKPQNPAATGTTATSSTGVSGQADDFTARFRGLGEALVELATEEAKQQTANLKTAGWVRRVRLVHLVTNLIISLVVQGFMVAWLYWEVTHLSSHSNLAPAVAANFMSFAYTSASAYMLGPRTDRKPNIYPSPGGATSAESESVNGDNRAGQGPNS